MKSKANPNSAVKPVYFAYWSDLWGFPIAKVILPFVASVPFVTPNIISILSFLLHTIGSVSLFLVFPYHLLVSAVLLVIAFIGDDLDGQLARYTNRTSVIGDYLDKVLDLLKVYILLLSLSYAVYITTNQILAFVLGFTACFFYTYRMYLKYVTMFISLDKDPLYFKKSQDMRITLVESIATKHHAWSKTLIGKVKIFLSYNRAILFVDEAEIAVFTAIGALFYRLDIALWILAISQLAIGIYKSIERIIQIKNGSRNLLMPMRK